MKKDFHSLPPPSAATSWASKEPPIARIVKFASDGAPEVLEFKDVPEPQPAAGEVYIRVKAIGLNRAEAAPSDVRRRVSGASTERWQITVHRVKVPQAWLRNSRLHIKLRCISAADELVQFRASSVALGALT